MRSSRARGTRKLIDQVRRIVQESGEPAGFDASHWLSQWLEEANPALGGKKPSELMGTKAGQELVSTLIARMQSAVIS